MQIVFTRQGCPINFSFSLVQIGELCKQTQFQLISTLSATQRFQTIDAAK